MLPPEPRWVPTPDRIRVIPVLWEWLVYTLLAALLGAGAVLAFHVIRGWPWA